MRAATTKLYSYLWLRYLLFPLALLYWGVIFWRNFFYRVGFFVSRRLPCIVISVGNLSLGGTGKTPAVIYLARLLQTNGFRVAVLSRGYQRTTSGTVLVSDGQSCPSDWNTVGDEPYLMALQLSGIPIMVDENRYRGGVSLVQRYNPDIIILDDAFQHRQLERDIDVVLINAQESVRDTKLFPYGRLREPLFHLRRADLIFWTKTNLAKPPTSLKSKINRLPVKNYLSMLSIDPELASRDNIITSESLAQKTVLALSAVGDPDGFERTLKSAGIDFCHHLRFADHHSYSVKDYKRINQAVRKNGCDCIVTTEKDLVKLIGTKDQLPVELYALRIAFSPSAGGEAALLRLVNQINK